MKQRYTVRGVGGTRIVIAEDEDEARHKAMCVRWGQPTGMYGPKYMGLGLDIVSVEPLDSALGDSSHS